LAVLLDAARRVATRAGAMRFLTLEDESAVLEARLPPPAYRRLDASITTPGPYLVDGWLRNDRGAVTLDIERMQPLHQRARASSGRR
jgi:DNA polymerase III alpha subunit